jgi:hypothetical protein
MDLENISEYVDVEKKSKDKFKADIHGAFGTILIGVGTGLLATTNIHYLELLGAGSLALGGGRWITCLNYYSYISNPLNYLKKRQ